MSAEQNAEQNHGKTVNKSSKQDRELQLQGLRESQESQESLEYLSEGISEGLRRKLEKYFRSHEGDNVPAGLYDRVINEIERVLFEVTLKHSAGNQSLAAKILGINRNTLRRKIQELDVSDFLK